MSLPTPTDYGWLGVIHLCYILYSFRVAGCDSFMLYIIFISGGATLLFHAQILQDEQLRRQREEEESRQRAEAARRAQAQKEAEERQRQQVST